MIKVKLSQAYSDGTYCWLDAVDDDACQYLGREYVQTTVTLALRNYNLPNVVSPWGWSGEDCRPCWQHSDPH